MTDTTQTERARAQEEIARLSTERYVIPEATSPDFTAPGECDLIMKGGITSGVVYPLTICKVATKYRLRNIGGTSAGAIAAVLAAAAEHRRQTDTATPEAGFQALAGVPNTIAPRLTELFQPPEEARGVFAVLMKAMAGGKLAGLLSVVRHRPAWFLGGLLLTLLATVPGLILLAGLPLEAEDRGRLALGLVLPVLLAIALGLVAAVVGFGFTVWRLLPRLDYGLTDGATHSGDRDNPALTDWLADEIDRVAGISEGCLTLSDLWGPEGLAAWGEHLGREAQGPSQTRRPVPLGEVTRQRTIDLETMTTDLTLHRPFRLPFRERVWLFDEEEMRSLFPDRVVTTMKAGLPPSGYRHPTTGAPLHWFPGPGTPPEVEGEGARPGPEALPVVVMARMSLSFPGLISAVPLYAVDRNGDQSVMRHLFSDGGIGSNFPMHFFDSLLPTRPTFGVNLSTPHPVYPDDMTWRPAPAEGGVLPRARPFDSLGGFGKAIADTMQNWSDNAQVTQRGFAERVVEIRLRPDEGGLNLQMPESLIMTLVARGAEAGDALLSFEWDAHRVIRYRTAMIRLTETLERFQHAWNDRDYADLISTYPTAGAPAASYADAQWWRDLDLPATQALMETLESWRAEGWPALREEQPSPAPVLRLAPE